MFYSQTTGKKIILRISAFVLALVLILGVMLAAAPKAEASADDGLVRVRLSSYGNKSSYTMQVVGAYQVEGYPELYFCDGEKFTVTANGSNVVLRDAGGNEYSISSSIKLVQRQSGKTNLLGVDSGYYYAGDMKVEVSGSSLLLTNIVYIETYLQGVLPYEMSNSWPVEALCAQAVAARTYAYSKMIAQSAYAYDVVDTTADQVYRGYDYKTVYSNCRTAIARTCGQVLIGSNGKPITASYTASNGGITEDGRASGATGASQAYLPYKVDAADLAVSLASGSAYSAKLYIPKQIDGSVLASSSTASYKMLRTQMQAQNIDVEHIEHVTVTAINLQSPRNASYPDRAYTGADIVVDIIYTDGTTATETLCFAGTKSGSVYLPFLNKVLGTSLSFRMLYLEELDDEFLLASVRYGHGTGMSQMGAKYRAQQGETYAQILAFYYECDNGGCTMSTKSWSAPAVSSVVDPALSLNATINGSQVNFRTGAGMSYDVIDTLDSGARVRVIYKASDWYKIYCGGKIGFVSASYVDEDTTTSGGSSYEGSGSTGGSSSENMGTTTPSVTTGKVTASTLYVRKGPGQNYDPIGYVRNGQTVTILKTENGWYQIKYGDSTGYVSGDYIGSVTSAGGTSTGGSTENTGSTIMTGTVSATSLLVRSGAGTNSSKIGSLAHGTKVILLEKTANGWYRIDYNGRTGYISGDYVTDVTATTTGGSTESTGSTTMTGTVSATSLLVRSGAGTNHSKIGSLARGTKVTLLEKTANGWYRIDYNGRTGYISGDYVTDVTGTTTGGSSISTATTGTVAASTLHVRNGAGANYTSIGGLVRGDKVTITGNVGGWYQIRFGNTTGYVSAQYITVSGSSSSGNTATGSTTTATVTASTLHVRSGPGAGYSIVGGVARGQSVTVLKKENGWCQIRHGSGTGYVSADYLHMNERG